MQRDLKPEIVKIESNGRAVLLDFGIARDARSTSLTRTHAVIGTLGTLAPEVLEGSPASPQSDVWSLGVLSLQMITGRAPYDASSHIQIRRIQDRGWRAAVAPHKVSPDLARILDRALEINPRQRFSDAAALLEALKAVPIGHSRDSRQSLHLSTRWQGLVPVHRKRIFAGVGAAIALGALGYYSISNYCCTLPANTAGTPIDASQRTAQRAMADVSIDTIDGPAQIFAQGRVIGTTPYRVRLPIGDKVDFELRRPGAHSTSVQFEVQPLENRYDFVLRRAP